MTPLENLDKAVRTFVESLELEDKIANVTWVLGYEAMHLEPDGGPSYTPGYATTDGLPLSSRIGISQITAKMLLDYATDGEDDD